MENNKLLALESYILLEQENINSLLEARVLLQWDSIDKNLVKEKIRQLDEKFKELKPIKNISSLSPELQAKLAIKFRNKKIAKVVLNTLAGAGAGAATGAGYLYGHAIGYNANVGYKDSKQAQKITNSTASAKEKRKENLKMAKIGGMAGAIRINNLLKHKSGKDTLTGETLARNVNIENIAELAAIGGVAGFAHGINTNLLYKEVNLNGRILFIREFTSKLAISLPYLNDKNKILIKTIYIKGRKSLSETEKIINASILLKEENIEMLQEGNIATVWNLLDKNKIFSSISKLDDKLSKEKNFKPVKNVNQLTKKQKIVIANKFKLKKIGGIAIKSLIAGLATNKLINSASKGALDQHTKDSITAQATVDGTLIGLGTAGYNAIKSKNKYVETDCKGHLCFITLKNNNILKVSLLFLHPTKKFKNNDPKVVVRTFSVRIQDN